MNLKYVQNGTVKIVKKPSESPKYLQMQAKNSKDNPM